MSRPPRSTASQARGPNKVKTLAQGEPAPRCERDRPGELVHIDNR